MNNFSFFAKVILSVLFCLLLTAATIAAQDEPEDEPPTRSITSKDFRANRAKSNAPVRRPAAGKTVTASANRRYKYTTRRKSIRRKSPDADAVKKVVYKTEELGITFWRLRPLKKFEINAADIATFSVRIGTDKSENWTAERVSSTTLFRPGDRVRFTIESSRTGYMYIVNREFYTDGSSGEASLIFPTLRTRGGDNRVRAGSLIEVPAADDSVPYFTVTPRREDYAGEELAVIITSAPIPGIEPERQAQRITREKVEQWLEDWGSTVDIYDAEDGLGIAYSVEEAAAANSTTRELFQEEPLPQTIYRLKVRADLPFIVPFQMRATGP